MRVDVDSVMCQAHGLCVARVPQLFELPDDAAVTRVVGDGTVPSELEADVEAAVLDCPEQAVVVS